MSCSLTYEELAEYTAGDALPRRAVEIAAHLEQCAECRRRIQVLWGADESLRAYAHEALPEGAALEAWRAIAQEAQARDPEIMKLDDVAVFLRVPLDSLERVVGDLPTFEVGGHIRVRRTKLMEWIEQRERRHKMVIAQSQLAHVLAGAGFRVPGSGFRVPGKKKETDPFGTGQ